jgi:hypothetical protein
VERPKRKRKPSLKVKVQNEYTPPKIRRKEGRRGKMKLVRDEEVESFTMESNRTARPNVPGGRSLTAVLEPKAVAYSALGTSNNTSTCVASVCASCSGRGWFPVNVAVIRTPKYDPPCESHARPADTYYQYAACDDFSMNLHRRDIKGLAPKMVHSCCCGVPGSIPEMIPRSKLMEMLDLTVKLAPQAAPQLVDFARRLGSPHPDTSQ